MLFKETIWIWSISIEKSSFLNLQDRCFFMFVWKFRFVLWIRDIIMTFLLTDIRSRYGSPGTKPILPLQPTRGARHRRDIEKISLSENSPLPVLGIYIRYFRSTDHYKFNSGTIKSIRTGFFLKEKTSGDVTSRRNSKIHIIHCNFNRLRAGVKYFCQLLSILAKRWGSDVINCG